MQPCQQNIIYSSRQNIKNDPFASTNCVDLTGNPLPSIICRHQRAAGLFDSENTFRSSYGFCSVTGCRTCQGDCLNVAALEKGIRSLLFHTNEDKQMIRVFSFPPLGSENKAEEPRLCFSSQRLGADGHRINTENDSRAPEDS